jgi:protein-histidine N-methyltransferase
MVFDSYGRKCNSRFLLNYGFIVDDNDANEVAITIHANRNDPLLSMKEEMLHESFPEIKIIRILDDPEGLGKRGNTLGYFYIEQNVMEF